MTVNFFILATLAALSQIVGNSLMVYLFGFKNFATAVTFAKTEAIQAAIVGVLLFGDEIEPLGWIGIALAGLGVMFVSFERLKISWQTLFLSLHHPHTYIGLASGLGYALAMLFVAKATHALNGGESFGNAALTLLYVLTVQSIGLALWMRSRTPADFRAIRKDIKAALWVGGSGAIASIGWFSAAALQTIAYVKSVGQVEMIFSIAVGFIYFKEKLSHNEWLGIMLTIVGIIVVLLTK